MTRLSLTLFAALLGLGSLGLWIAFDQAQGDVQAEAVVSIDTICETLHDHGVPCHVTARVTITLEAPQALVDEATDACADYVAQGLACEYIAFPDMEIRPEPLELAGAL